MAECSARDRAEKDGQVPFEFSSAGVAAEVGCGSPPETLEALARRGLDGRKHRARQVTGRILEDADLILCMEKAHKDWIVRRFPDTALRVKMFKAFAGLPGDPEVPDPYGLGPDGNALCLAELDRGLDKIFKLLKTEEKS